MCKILLCFSFLLVTAVLAEFTAQDCRELGFIKSQLMCSSCDELTDFGLEEIKPQCKECCQRDQNTSANRKYPKAILEVCTCKFGAYPQIQAFIKSDRPAKFRNLHIKYVRGLDPIVKLLDKNDNVIETLSINKWNTDTVQEFFETHLETPGVSSGNKSDDEEDYLKTNRV